MIATRRLPLWPLLALLTLPGGCPTAADDTDDPNRPNVRINTTLGSILVELNRQAAPVTVDNFLQYVNEGFYDGTIFHRVVPNFFAQGGGFTSGLVGKQTRDPIINESANGLQNLRGTIAMARLEDPNSASSQFYINVTNNATLDATAEALGYAVFGTVVEGITVVDLITGVPTGTTGSFENVPITDVVILSAVVETAANRPLDPNVEQYVERFQFGVLNILRDLLVAFLENAAFLF